MQRIMTRYMPLFDENLRASVQTHLIEAEGFGLMIRYAMGWVDQDDVPYQRTTGKRLRPILLLLVCNAVGGDWQKATPAAVSVELLHNFSLIHDDIQDGSSLRHNRPTVWQVWGIANAINAGDALFTLAYSALSDLDSNLPPEIVFPIWKKFNATNIQLTRGQHLDMRFEHLDSVSTEEYISMITGKSAALLATCAYIGALVGCGDENRAKKLEEFGLNIGIAFQIHDDILGIWGDPTVTGKSIHTDILSRKKSLPVLFGLAHSAELRELYAQEVFDDAEVIRAVNLLNALKADEFAREQEAFYYEKGIQALTDANITDDSEIMTLIDFLFERNY